MKIWMLTQFAPHGEHPDIHEAWPVAASYASGHVAPRHPDTADGWALVLCLADPHHIEAAREDPRIKGVYRTVWEHHHAGDCGRLRSARRKTGNDAVPTAVCAC
jgi:hypothetical protein